MSNLIDLFKTNNLDETKIIGENNFFQTSSQLFEQEKLQKRFLSKIDYSDPKNFVKFGSAEEYYKTSIEYINSSYPISNEERIKWLNSLTDFDYYFFNNKYPKQCYNLRISGSNKYVYTPAFKAFTSSIDPIDAFQQNYSSKEIEYLDLSKGFTFESWLRFETGSNQNSDFTVLFLTTVKPSGSYDFEGTSLLKIYQTGSTLQISGNAGVSASFDYQIPYNSWGHYAFRVTNNSVDLFVNGELEQTKITNNLCNSSSYAILRGGFIPNKFVPTASFTTNFGNREPIKIGGGAAVHYFDEVRFWNEKRTEEEIGRNWFTTIDGNYFESGSLNKNLLVYYKFNEEFTDFPETIIDYSGRQNHAMIYNKSGNQFQLSGSAIDSSSLSSDNERPIPIIAPSISSSTTLYNFYTSSIDLGKEYDFDNMHSLYKKFPAWITEEEADNDVKHLKQVVQIISVYFDDLFNKIKELSSLKHIDNFSDAETVYPFYDTILSSTGFDVKELFNNLNIIENILSRQDKNIFNVETQKVKNLVLQNIYNNLYYILKSKGTEKSIRSFLRSYGVNENLLKINLYADKSLYRIQEKNQETTVKKKVAYLYKGESIFTSGSGVNFENSGSFSLETSFSLLKEGKEQYVNSIFGLIGISGSSFYNFNVALDYEVSDNSYRFTVYSGSNFTPIASSSNFTDAIFDDSIWNLAIKCKPDVDSTKNASSYNYFIEFFGTNNNSVNNLQFSSSASIPTASFNNFNNNGSFYPYVGAVLQSLTGSTLAPTYQKSLYVNLWNDYLDNDSIIAHNKDITNYGFE